MSWFVYLLECSDGSLYTGIARDPVEREAVHNKGAGAAYTRSRRPVRLAYVEPAADRPAALRRELSLKTLSRKRKLELRATRAAVRPEAPLLSVAGFGAPHGFATRAGGVSSGAWASLNLRVGIGDDEASVTRNREIFAGWFGVAGERVCELEQVHGEQVVVAQAGQVARADAQISDDPSLLLVIATADCFPLLFHDSRTGAVGAAHCGWRGTVSRLAARTVQGMTESFGSRPADIEVAVGPGICGSCYQVGPEVMERFRREGLAEGFAVADGDGHWLLDLAAANRQVLVDAGVSRGRITFSGACTSCDPGRFFSHRRDAGVTGRHWAAVRANPGG